MVLRDHPRDLGVFIGAIAHDYGRGVLKGGSAARIMLFYPFDHVSPARYILCAMMLFPGY